MSPYNAGIMTKELQSFLELNLPKVKPGKKVKYSVGLAEPKLGSAILESTGIPCVSNNYVLEFLRGIRLHFRLFIKDLKVNTWFFIFCILSVIRSNMCFSSGST